MKSRCRILLLSLMVLFSAVSICGAVEYRVTELTNNNCSGLDPKINNDGHVVWWGRCDRDDNDEIFLYNGASVTNISNNSSVSDRYPQISDNGHVFWVGDDGSDTDIYLYDGTGVANISNNPSVRDEFHALYRLTNDNGWVVWEGRNPDSYTDIYLFDGTNVTNITNSPTVYDHYPHVNNNGHVVWNASSDGYYAQIYLYDGTSVTNITNNPSISAWEPKINNNGHVVWAGHDTNYEIYLYDGTSVTNISNSTLFSDTVPRINDNGYVVWRKGMPDTADKEIFLYDGSAIINITNNPGNHTIPDINESGHVVWNGGLGSRVVYHYDGTSVINISDDCDDHNMVYINDDGYVVWSSDYSVQLAKPIPSASAASKDLQVSIPGSGCFSILLENPNALDFTVSPSISWTGTAPTDVTFTGSPVTVPAGGSQTVTMPCFTVGANAPAGNYDFDILWTGIDSGSNPVNITTDPTLHLVSGSGISVGGTAVMADKMELLAPWIALTTLAVLSAGVFVIKRFRELKK